LELFLKSILSIHQIFLKEHFNFLKGNISVKKSAENRVKCFLTEMTNKGGTSILGPPSMTLLSVYYKGQMLHTITFIIFLQIQFNKI